MRKTDKIKVIDDNGEILEAEVIAYFTLKSNNKSYLIYTQNKEDGKGNVEVYISEVVRHEEGMCVVTGIKDEKAWKEVLGVISDLSKGL